MSLGRPSLAALKIACQRPQHIVKKKGLTAEGKSDVNNTMARTFGRDEVSNGNIAKGKQIKMGNLQTRETAQILKVTYIRLFQSWRLLWLFDSGKRNERS